MKESKVTLSPIATVKYLSPLTLIMAQRAFHCAKSYSNRKKEPIRTFHRQQWTKCCLNVVFAFVSSQLNTTLHSTKTYKRGPSTKSGVKAYLKSISKYANASFFMWLAGEWSHRWVTRAICFKPVFYNSSTMTISLFYKRIVKTTKPYQCPVTICSAIRRTICKTCHSLHSHQTNFTSLFPPVF